MLFATVASGFKAGGINQAIAPPFKFERQDGRVHSQCRRCHILWRQH